MTLMDLTLPGSHNAGNYEGGLSLQRCCESDYRYAEYLQDPSTRAAETPLTQQEFDTKFIPWNINHSEPIAMQLRDHGVRFVHMKICNFGDPGAATMDLDQVVFQHRGYTTKESLSSMLDEMSSFLAAHTKEMIVLGFNNLHNCSPGGFNHIDILALSQALVEKLGRRSLVTKEELYTQSLSVLIGAGRRVAIFMKGDATVAAQMPVGIIPSIEAFVENWDDVMKSGDIIASAAWLAEDLKVEASKRNKFYVMQANPNDDEANMYARMNAQGKPESLQQWLAQFLEGLKALVELSIEKTPFIRINAVSTDFLGISKPVEIAFALMGLPMGDKAVSGPPAGFQTPDRTIPI